MAGLFSVALISGPQWASAVWSLFYNEPMFAVIRRNWGQQSAALLRWAPVVIGIALLLVIIILVIRTRGAGADVGTINTQTDLPIHRPIVAPHSVEKREHTFGLTVTNPGYAAFDVHIPSVQVGASGYSLVFPETLPQLLERDHKRFVSAWLEHPTLPGRDGGALFDVMRMANVDLLKFAIVYKDAQTHWYRTNCILERNVNVAGGLTVGFVGQELAESSPEQQPTKHEALRERLPQEPPLDVAFVWDWHDVLKNNPGFLGAAESNKDIIIDNRSDRYIYNVQIRPIELAEKLTFDKIPEIKPRERAIPLPRWRNLSRGSPIVQMFLCESINESAAESAGLMERMTTGLLPYRLRLPMDVDYETRISRHTSHATFFYDAVDSRFEQFPLMQQEPTSNTHPRMATGLSFNAEWKDLAGQFEKLQNYTRADWQCNRRNNRTTYEVWRVTGGSEGKPCETLCRYAGTLLLKSPKALATLSDNTRRQVDPVWRWLYFLKENHRASHGDGLHPPIGDDGTIYLLESISDLASKSWQACTDCAALEL